MPAALVLTRGVPGAKVDSTVSKVTTTLKANSDAADSKLAAAEKKIKADAQGARLASTGAPCHWAPALRVCA